MKISELNNKTFLNAEGAQTSSYVIVNYKDNVTSSTVTNKTNLDVLGKAIATNLNLVRYNSGELQTYTVANSTYVTVNQDITGKADKVSSATNGNFAGLDSNGNLIDSGHAHSDYLTVNLKGAANGVAELDNNGKVPAAQLPSYVDDVLEYSSTSAFPETGETDKIYIATDTNLTYRWSGSAYVEISQSLALGETSSTAYRGDYGAIAHAHASNKGSAYASGLYKITTNSEGHVTAAEAPTLNDILTLTDTDNHKLNDWIDITSACTITTGVTGAKVLLNKALNLGFFSCQGPANAGANTTLITLTPVGKVKYNQYFPNNVIIPEKTKVISQQNASVNAVGSSGIFMYQDVASHILTINYKYANDTEVSITDIPADSRNITVEEWDSFTINSPNLAHYQVSPASITGTMGEEDITRDVVYTPIEHTLTINYTMSDVQGSTSTPSAPSTYSANYAEDGSYGNSNYSVNSPTVQYFTPDVAVVSGTMQMADITTTVTYTRNTHTLTINYVDTDNEPIETAYIETVGAGLSYSISSPSVTDYTPDIVTVEGTMLDEDVTITVTYTANTPE